MNKQIKPDDDWQRVWLSAREKDWSSLVLVPNDDGVDVVRFAERLATTGRVPGERPVIVVNGTGVQLSNVQETLDLIAAATARGERAIVPIDPLADHPAAISILRAASAALLIVRLGESMMTVARTTIETVGRDRLIGSVVVQPRTPDVAAPRRTISE